MMRLIANRALKKYGTRKLNPGDEFDATDKDGRLLVGLRRAREARAYVFTIDFDELRKKAEALGIKVDGRWSAKRLQSEIDVALAAGPDAA
jgi:hypothetical protein